MKPSFSRFRTPLVEFATIVVGVLVALAVDDWATHRTERRLEEEYLQRLVADLRADTAELGRVVWRWRKYESSGRMALEFLADPVTPGDPEELLAAFVLTGFTVLPDIETATYDELKSSGLLRIIQAPEIRRALSDYQAMLAFGDPFIERQSQEYRLFMHRRLPPDLVRALIPDCLSVAATVCRTRCVTSFL